MSRADIQERDRLLDQIERLEKENDKLSSRIGELTGHLDWIGWSSDGVAKAQSEIERLRCDSGRTLQNVRTRNERRNARPV